jgi:hypothetical protein
VSIVHRESFEYGDVINGALPTGWECEEQFAAWITKDNEFQIQPANHGDWSGTVFWFSKEKITPNTGVYFTFKYIGNQEGFTLGLDAIKNNGERIPNGESGFHSVAMQMMDALSAHIIKDAWQNSDSFEGNLRLREDTWYETVLALDDSNNYMIKIWQPDTPEQQITYFKKWDDFPDEYYFISWVTAKRRLLIDDFTVFKFEEIAQE